MSGQGIPAPASLPVPPPFSVMQFTDPATGKLTVQGIRWLQTLWAAIFGSAGIVDLEAYIIAALQAPPFQYSPPQAYVPFLPSENSVKAGSDGFGLCAAGLLLDGEFLGSAVWGFDISFPSGKIPDEASSELMAAADAVFNFIVGGSIVGDTVVGGSIVGTLTWAMGSMTGTTSWGAGYTLAAGTVLLIAAPSPADGTLANLTAAIYGDRQ